MRERGIDIWIIIRTPGRKLLMFTYPIVRLVGLTYFTFEKPASESAHLTKWWVITMDELTYTDYSTYLFTKTHRRRGTLYWPDRTDIPRQVYKHTLGIM